MEFKLQAAEVKKDNVVDMAVTFTAMIRVFEKDSKPEIVKLLKEVFFVLPQIKTKDEYDRIHSDFCINFSKKIKTAEKRLKNGTLKKSGFASFGHAAKVLDIAIKVYVYYGSLPDENTSEIIKPFLNGAIDTPILNYLNKKYPKNKVEANNIESINQEQYENLQNLVVKDINNRFGSSIFPVQYDDILWNELNR